MRDSRGQIKTLLNPKRPDAKPRHRGVSLFLARYPISGCQSQFR